MTAVERRFLAGFRELDSGSAGLIQKDDGTIWLVNPDGSETQLPGGGGSAVQVGSGTPVGSVTPSGIGAQYLDSDTDTLYVATGVTSADWAATGGGSQPFVYATVFLDSGGTALGTSPSSFHYTVDQVSISYQVGTDLSVVDDSGKAAIVSASGGVFQATAYWQSPGTGGLDGGSSVQRQILLAFNVGEGLSLNDHGLDVFGGDLTAPIVDGYWIDTKTGGPGFCAAGERALWSIGVFLSNAFGTDAVSIDACTNGDPSLVLYKLPYQTPPVT